MQLSEAISEYLRQLRDIRLASGHTVAAYRRDLEHFLAHCGDVPLSTINRRQIQDWLVAAHASGLAQASLARRLALITIFSLFSLQSINKNTVIISHHCLPITYSPL